MHRSNVKSLDIYFGLSHDVISICIRYWDRIDIPYIIINWIVCETGICTLIKLHRVRDTYSLIQCIRTLYFIFLNCSAFVKTMNGFSWSAVYFSGFLSLISRSRTHIQSTFYPVELHENSLPKLKITIHKYQKYVHKTLTHTPSHIFHVCFVVLRISVFVGDSFALFVCWLLSLSLSLSLAHSSQMKI